MLSVATPRKTLGVMRKLSCSRLLLLDPRRASERLVSDPSSQERFTSALKAVVSISLRNYHGGT